MNNVKLSDKHLNVIAKALEVYYRMRSGQIGIALDVAYNYSLSWEEKDALETIVKLIAFKGELKDGRSYGIGHSKIGDASVAYDIRKTFEEFLAVTNNDGYYEHTSEFDGPLRTSNEPVPEVVGFVRYKDFHLSKELSIEANRLHKEKKFNELWQYIDSLEIPKGSKSECIQSLENVTIRVWRPNRIKQQDEVV